MKKVYEPASRVHKMLHSDDYFPEQWVDYPEILEEDIRLMKLSKSNVMSMGMFAWGKLEPEEGVFDFEWLDNVLVSLEETRFNGFLGHPVVPDHQGTPKNFLRLRGVPQTRTKHFN